MKRLIIFLNVLFVSLIAASAADAQEAQVESSTYNLMLKGLLKGDVPELSAKDAYQLQDQAVFVDTRSKEEYEVSHIKDAVWVGYDNFDANLLANIDKNTKLIAYCSVGARSEKITRQLQAKGYTDVANMYGGIFEWVNQDFPVYKKEKKPTEEVHAYNKAWGVWLNKGQKVYQPQPE